MNRLKHVGASILVMGVILLVVVAAVTLIMPMFQSTTPLRIGSDAFDAGLANTPATREKGLGGVMNLGPKQALILAFPNDDQWQIWMKGMKIPIDIVWLDQTKKVVYIINNVSPDDPSIFTPPMPTRYVIEFPAGTVADKNITLGSSASFDIKSGDIK